jgi:hypothetical protein
MLLLGVLALAHRASAIKNLVVFGDSYSGRYLHNLVCRAGLFAITPVKGKMKI